MQSRVLLRLVIFNRQNETNESHVIFKLIIDRRTTQRIAAARFLSGTKSVKSRSASVQQAMPVLIETWIEHGRQIKPRFLRLKTFYVDCICRDAGSVLQNMEHCFMTGCRLNRKVITSFKSSQVDSPSGARCVCRADKTEIRSEVYVLQCMRRHNI